MTSPSPSPTARFGSDKQWRWPRFFGEIWQGERCKRLLQTPHLNVKLGWWRRFTRDVKDWFTHTVWSIKKNRTRVGKAARGRLISLDRCQKAGELLTKLSELMVGRKGGGALEGSVGAFQVSVLFKAKDSIPVKQWESRWGFFFFQSPQVCCAFRVPPPPPSPFNFIHHKCHFDFQSAMWRHESRSYKLNQSRFLISPPSNFFRAFPDLLCLAWGGRGVGALINVSPLYAPRCHDTQTHLQAPTRACAHLLAGDRDRQHTNRYREVMGAVVFTLQCRILFDQ